MPHSMVPFLFVYRKNQKFLWIKVDFNKHNTIVFIEQQYLGDLSFTVTGMLCISSSLTSNGQYFLWNHTKQRRPFPLNYHSTFYRNKCCALDFCLCIKDSYEQNKFMNYTTHHSPRFLCRLTALIKLLVAVQRQRVLYTETIEFASQP
jgi:hypothetical protein